MSSPAASKPSVVEFYFDVLSPYSYLAFEQLVRYKTEWNLDLRIRPVLAGAIMAKSGNVPPATVAAKRTYLARDLTRVARNMGLPFRFPRATEAVFVGSLPIQRLLIAIQLKYPQQVETVLHNFWRRHWAEDKDILSRESQIVAVTTGTGLTQAQAEELLAMVSTPEVKAILVKNTDEALSHGAYGVPSLVVVDQKGKNQFIFGSDRFPVIADLLGKAWKGPFPDAIPSKL